jgi:hypothetical protein
MPAASSERRAAAGARRGSPDPAEPAYSVDEAVDAVLFTDPDVPAARVVKLFPPRLAALWSRALDRPANDLKCQAAVTIALAHRRGMRGLDTAVSALLQTLDQPEQHPTVRLAAAQALIGLDARQAAASLFAHAQSDGIDMRNLVEPALARWNYAPARAAWLERLNQSGLPGRGWVLAIRGLGAVRDPKAGPRLRELVLAPDTGPILRLEAARALGIIHTAGLEKDAARLATEQTSPPALASLLAAALLRHHRSDEAVTALQRLAVGAEPAAAAIALQALLDADPHRMLPLMPQVLASPDAAVRTLGIEAHRRCPTPDDVASVAERMDDPHSQVRTAARKALAEVARQPALAAAVRQEAMRLLATARWRALEQATILLAVLDHKPAASRFVELLQFERPEVFVAAAWGLRKLAVPETFPAQLGEVERRWRQSQQRGQAVPRSLIDRQVAQLNQSLGQARYAPAAAALARFVPKEWNIGPESRAAAIWALGLIHQKNPPRELVEALTDRLTDESVMMAEDRNVRRMAAVALGRMKAADAIDALKKYYPRKLSTDALPNACGWALQQITGEILPPSGTATVVQKGWFLETDN